MLWDYIVFLRNTGYSFQNKYTDRETHTVVFGVQTCIHPSSVSPITSHVNACAGMNNTLANHTESKTGLTQTFPSHCVIDLQSVADAYFNNSV